ncbi:MAG TPA: toxin-antitoxin system HicB family antitoxin [Mycobacteriales bacterium]|jgi:hypothetical protein|nr:toxin-antitoxin system HicB family antitoxin [Mycobacteriales bacterium]
MQISAVTAALSADLVALGSLGDEATAEVAQRLSIAMTAPISARLVELLGQVAAELDSTLTRGRVEVRLVGGDAELVLVDDEDIEPVGETPAADSDADARISLRLPSPLKVRIEAAATSAGISVNAYIVRALQRPQHHQQPGHRRLTGYGRS